jgi:hypothetical protein
MLSGAAAWALLAAKIKKADAAIGSNLPIVCSTCN